MIDGDGEYDTTRILREALGQYRTIQVVIERRFRIDRRIQIHRGIEYRERGKWRYYRRLIDQGDANDIAAYWSGRDVIVGAGCGRIVKAIHQVGKRDLGGVVLELDQPDYVGVHLGDCFHQLGPLQRELRWCVGTPTTLQGERATQRSDIVVQRGEIVQHVERCHANYATDIRRSRPGINPLEINRTERLQLIVSERFAEYSGQARNGIAGSQRVAFADVGRQRHRVLYGSAIVQLNTTEIIDVPQCDRARPRHRNVCRIIQRHVRR